MPAIEGFLTGAMGGAGDSGDMGSDPWASEPYQPEAYTPDTNPQYAQALLGSEPLSVPDLKYDKNGEIIVPKGIEHRAQMQALSQVLMGASQSLLEQDPRYVIEAGSRSAQEYKSAIDEGRARIIADRTRAFQEAQLKSSLIHGINENEKDKMVLRDMKNKFDQDRMTRTAIGNSAKELHKHIMQKVSEDDTILPEERDLIKQHLDIAGAMYQSGNAELAMQYTQKAESMIPAYKRDEIRREIDNEQFKADIGMRAAGNHDLYYDVSTGKLMSREEHDRDVREQEMRISATGQSIAESKARIAAAGGPGEPSAAVEKARADANDVLNLLTSVRGKTGVHGVESLPEATKTKIAEMIAGKDPNDVLDYLDFIQSQMPGSSPADTLLLLSSNRLESNWQAWINSGKPKSPQGSVHAPGTGVGLPSRSSTRLPTAAGRTR